MISSFNTVARWAVPLAISIALFNGSCGGDAAVTPPPTQQPGTVPSPAPPVPPVTEEPDWDSVTLSMSNGDDVQFRLDDNGNYSATGGFSGQIANSELNQLDSRIDAIKEEAHDPFQCEIAQFTVELSSKVSMTFRNRGPALIYQIESSTGEQCWSGSLIPVLELQQELQFLQNKYTS